jgi:nucleotide-binding universal stress UspA family protein
MSRIPGTGLGYPQKKFSDFEACSKPGAEVALADEVKGVVMKILIAVDGSTCSDAAIDEVIQRPWPPQSEVRAITAFEVPVMVGIEPWAATPNYFEQLEKSVREGARSTLDQSLKKLKVIENETLRISGEAIEGAPGQVIVEEAQRWGADLIVMGSRGLGTWNRLLLGSVSSNVVHHARCSVEIVRR